MTRARWWSDALTALVVAAVLLGPALWSTGHILRGDMVFVPDMPWKPAWLGLDGSMPRAVPMDAVVWALTAVLPGWLVQRMALVVPIVLGGVGLGRLLGDQPWGVRAVAVVAFWWNPWVAERLSTGHWTMVAGHAVLPWVVIGARRMRSTDRWDVLVGSLAVAGVCGPPTLLSGLALGVVLVVGRGGGGRRVGVLVASGVAAALPWLAPSLALSWAGVASGDPFSAFAVRAESAAGLAASVVSGGGIWKASVWPPERASAVVVALSALLAVGALAVLWRRALPASESRRVCGLAVATAVLVWCSGSRVGASALDALADVVPAITVARDTHRLLGVLVLAVALGLATSVSRLWAAARPDREWTRIVAAGLAVTPLALLPTAGWGLGGDLRASHFPQEWAEVRAILQGETGSVAVLPWRGTYRGFDWNGAQAVLDPAPRYFPGDVLIDDRVYLGDGVVLGSEDPRLERIGRALAAEDVDELRSNGVRFVLAHRHNAPGDLPPGSIVHRGADITLVDLGTGGVVEQDEGVPLLVWVAWIVSCLTAVLVITRELRIRLYSSAQH